MLREFFDEALDIALRGLGVNLEFGADVIRRYRAMENATRRAIAKDLTVLERSLRSTRRKAS